MTPLATVRVAALTLFALALAACTSAPVKEPPPPTPASTIGSTVGGDPVVPVPASTPETTPPSVSGACVIVGNLSTREQLAQLLMVGVDPSGTAQARYVVTQEGVGGIFVGGDATGLITSGALSQLNTDTPLRVMVAVDEEGGRVQRIDELAGSTPSARAMVKSGMTVAQVHKLALDRGTALRKYGITVDFAPDVDVSNQPDRTVIGDRSFSADPATVTEYGGAFAQGLRKAGVLPVLKHFPGHGQSSGDSHQGAVTVPPLAALQERDLVPFRNLVASSPPGGVAIMVGHLDVPGLTEPGTPASLSPAAIGLLRQGTGYGAKPFGGVIISDDLAGMAAITDKYDLPLAVLDTLKAGSDIALIGTANRVPAVLNNLEQAVQDGELPRDQVQASLRRVLAAKGVPVCA